VALANSWPILTWLTFWVLASRRRVELPFWLRFGWNLNTRIGP
jgi:hypothetical protein